MKLSELSAKPKLVSVIIDDEEIVKEYGEPLEFYTYDRQPVDVFLKLASIDQNNPSMVIDAVRKLILDENGKEIITQDGTLPSKVLMKVIQKAVESLGKF